MWCFSNFRPHLHVIFKEKAQLLWLADTAFIIWACNVQVLRSQVGFYLRMFLLFVVLKICPGYWLLTHITQGNVSPTVNLMGGEISLWNIVFTEERNTKKYSTQLPSFMELTFQRNGQIWSLTSCHRTGCFHQPCLPGDLLTGVDIRNMNNC